MLVKPASSESKESRAHVLHQKDRLLVAFGVGNLVFYQRRGCASLETLHQKVRAVVPFPLHCDEEGCRLALPAVDDGAVENLRGQTILGGPHRSIRA